MITWLLAMILSFVAMILNEQKEQWFYMFSNNEIYIFITMILQTDDYMFASNDISLLAMILNQQWFYMFSNNEIYMLITMVLPNNDFIFVSNDIIVVSNDIIVDSDDFTLTMISHVF